MAKRPKRKRLPRIHVVEGQLEDGSWAPAETVSLKLAAFVEESEAQRCVYNREVSAPRVRIRPYERSRP